MSVLITSKVVRSRPNCDYWIERIDSIDQVHYEIIDLMIANRFVCILYYGKKKCKFTYFLWQMCCVGYAGATSLLDGAWFIIQQHAVLGTFSHYHQGPSPTGALLGSFRWPKMTAKMSSENHSGKFESTDDPTYSP